MAADSTYKGVLDGEPILWRVDGLPFGEEAIDAKSMHGVWKFLRTSGDHQWSAEHTSEADVLRALATELEAHRTRATDDGSAISHQQAPGPAFRLVEVCWRMRGPSGQVLECSVYPVATGLEVRAGYGPDVLVRSELVEHIESARMLAAAWHVAVLAKGGFEEIPIE